VVLANTHRFTGQMASGFRTPSKVARRLMLTPLAARKIKNWPRFMFNYALGVVPDAPYAFRNRARLRIGRGVDHVPIIEIFLREEYGKVDGGAVILDIGANIGAFSIYAAMSARDVTVYAYEPMTEFYRLMQENVRINRLEHAVKCFNLAVGADTRVRELAVESNTFLFPTLLHADDGTVTRTVSVPCTSLADILESNELERVGLLKMDCEGAEYEILYNTPDRYLERIREIRMEYHNLQTERCNGEALGTFLRSRGYEVTVARVTSAAQTSGNLWARKHD
jgi:FkbM family methyltransferase